MRAPRTCSRRLAPTNTAGASPATEPAHRSSDSPDPVDEGLLHHQGLELHGEPSVHGYAWPGQPHSHRTGRAAHPARRFVQKGFPMTTTAPAEPQLTDAWAGKFTHEA